LPALLGWTKDELYRVPPQWSRVDLCGAALLIGDRRVVAGTEASIVIEARSGSRLKFRRLGREHLAFAAVRLPTSARRFAAEGSRSCLRLVRTTGSSRNDAVRREAKVQARLPGCADEWPLSRNRCRAQPRPQSTTPGHFGGDRASGGRALLSGPGPRQQSVGHRQCA
jgi:hypothetical protein